MRLPLSLRRRSTRRPAAVAMRARKPCLCLRLRFDGWYSRPNVACLTSAGAPSDPPSSMDDCGIGELSEVDEASVRDGDRQVRSEEPKGDETGAGTRRTPLDRASDESNLCGWALCLVRRGTGVSE